MSKSDVTFNGETITAITVEGFTLELNQDPDMKVSEIRDGAEEIELFERRVLGRAEGLDDNFDSASTEFTDVIKWNIDDESEIQFDVWMNVCKSLRFCAGLTEEWADALSEYKQERRRLIQDWNDRASVYETDPSLGAPSDYTDSENAENALRELKDEIEGEEHQAHFVLNTKATDVRSELASGPTPDAVQRLVDGGYFNWSYFNLSGEVETLPNDMAGDDAAQEVADFAGDPENYDGDIAAIMAILNNMALRSVDKNDNREDFNNEEISFLEDFYDTLEEFGGENTQPPGVLNVANQISTGESIDTDTKELILGALGGGVLVLSDEKVNGDYEKLPPSIREASEGAPENSPGVGEWHSNIFTLSQMFEQTDANVQGGEKISVNLTHSMGHMLDDTDSPEELPFPPENLQTVIDVSTRNEDANLEVLTHEDLLDEDEKSDYSRDNETTLRGLFTHDWEDAGEALSGLTDWIWEQADGSEEEQERAADGLIGLVTSLGENSDDFLKIEQGDGEQSVTAAQLNSELAESWTKVFSTHVDHFAISTGSETNQILKGDSHTPMFDDGEIIASMPPGNRQDFIQLLVSEESSEPHVLLAAIDYEHRNLHGAIFDGNKNPGDYANDAGRLRGMINGAIMQEFESREASAETAANEAQVEAAAKWEAAYSIGKDLLGKGVSTVPVAGPVLSEGLSFAGTIFDAEAKEYIEERVQQEVDNKRDSLDNGDELFDRGEFREDQAQWNIELQIAHMLMEKGILSRGDFDSGEGAEVLVEGDNGEPMLPMSQQEWDSGHSSRAATVRATAEYALAEAGSDIPAEDVLEEYIEYYVRSFDPLHSN